MILSLKPLDEEKYIQPIKNHYASRAVWSSLSNGEQHIELCACESRRKKHFTLTGQSACAIRGISRSATFEMRPHAICVNNKTSSLVRWHFGEPDQTAEIIDGMLVAGPLRAVCDLAGFDTPESLLASINDCLFQKLFTKEQLDIEIESREGRNGHKILQRLATFATGKCESPLETKAWIEVYKAGFEMPMQQVVIKDGWQKYRVDMLWESHSRKIILEIDGLVKYKTMQDIYDEKEREDALRDMGYEFIRVTYKQIKEGRFIEKLERKEISKRRNQGLLFPV
jgi:very-short-patch-repair endonuclease